MHKTFFTLCTVIKSFQPNYFSTKGMHFICCCLQKYQKLCSSYVVVDIIRVCTFALHFWNNIFFLQSFFVECFLRQYVFVDLHCFHICVTISGWLRNTPCQQMMYLLLNNLLHAFCSTYFFCITFPLLCNLWIHAYEYLMVPDLNSWYLQFSQKHGSMKSAFVGQKLYFY